MIEKRIWRLDLIIFCLLIIIALAGLIYFVNYTGYASLESRGGTITEVRISQILGNPEYWSGVHGVAVLVPEYNLPFSLDVYANKIHLGIFLFNCFQRRIPHELYASLINSTNLNWSSLQPATPEDIDNFLGINYTNSNVSATRMFTNNMTVQIGNITYIVPALYTKKYDEAIPQTYDTGVLKDGDGNLVFVSHIYLYNFSLCYYGGICNYQMMLPVRNCTSLINQTNNCISNASNYTGYEHYNFFNDPTDYCPSGENPFLDYGNVSGNVTDASGNILDEVLIVVGEYATFSNSSDTIRNYHIRLPVGQYYIFAVKSGYQTYVNQINITFENMTFHNIIMQLTPVQNDNQNTKTHDYDYEYEVPPQIQMPARIEGRQFIISISAINRTIKMGEFIQEAVNFQNLKNSSLRVNLRIDGIVKDLIQMDNSQLVIASNENIPLVLTIFGNKEPGVYDGYLNVSGDINAQIPITITIVKDRLPVEALLLDVEVYNKVVNVGDKLQFRTKLNNMLTATPYPVFLRFTIQNKLGNETYWYDTANINLITSFSLFKEVPITDKLKPGDYVVRVTAEYLGLSSSASDTFRVQVPIYMMNLLGFAAWKWLLLLLLLLLAYLVYRIVKKYLRSKKKYDVPIDMGSLPKKDKKALFIGLLAETKNKAYLNSENLTTHTIVAGSTGGGKSFSAQVIVEEALQKKKSVIVFDPTGQWTGFLRKLTDKSLLRKYPDFDMNPEMAKGSDGNIKVITNPYEEIQLKKFIKPGEIHIFVLNRLQPEEIDIFVGNTIMQVFNQHFEESRELKILMVYDEVHRLLPKFGGSGVGLLQLERGCREFRKWGIGLIMISQVLGDFVEEIRANIGTEIQMRTRDESDLERIKEKYSDIFKKTLLRSVVGTGMIQNADYNKGRPYYVTFRPILHSIQKLSEEELNKYAELNEVLSDIEYQLEQLEKEKQDVFDLQLELKLAYDKLKTGAFSIVDVYLEGLTPRIENIWKKIGKKPQKREIKLIDKKLMEQEIKKAEEARKKYEKQNQQEIVYENKDSENLSSQTKITDQIKDEALPNKNKEFSKFEYSLPITKAITFDDGQSATSLSEVIDALQGMTPSVFKNHVSKNNNDIANWIKNEFKDDKLSANVKKITKKEELLEFLNDEKLKKEKIVLKNADEIQEKIKTNSLIEKNISSTKSPDINEQNIRLSDKSGGNIANSKKEINRNRYTKGKDYNNAKGNEENNTDYNQDNKDDNKINETSNNHDNINQKSKGRKGLFGFLLNRPVISDNSSKSSEKIMDKIGQKSEVEQEKNSKIKINEIKDDKNKIVITETKDDTTRAQTGLVKKSENEESAKYEKQQLKKTIAERINKSLTGFFKTKKNDLKEQSIETELTIPEPLSIEEQDTVIKNEKTKKNTASGSKTIIENNLSVRSKEDSKQLMNQAKNILTSSLHEKQGSEEFQIDEISIKKEIEQRIKKELGDELKKEVEGDLKKEIEIRIRKEIEDERFNDSIKIMSATADQDYKKSKEEIKSKDEGTDELSEKERQSAEKLEKEQHETDMQEKEKQAQEIKEKEKQAQEVKEKERQAQEVKEKERQVNETQEKQKTLEKRFSNIDFSKINALELKYRADSLETIDEKIYLFEKREKYLEKDPSIKFSLAVLYQLKTDYENAEKQYKKILEIIPNNTDIMMRLGLVLKYEKKYDEAIDYIRKVLTLEPQNIKAKMVLEQLEGEKAL